MTLRQKKGLRSCTVRQKWVILISVIFVFVSALSFAGEMKYQV